MIGNTREDLYALTLDLCRIPSVSGSPRGENDLALRIAEHLSDLPYFRTHPEDLRLLPAVGDPAGRRNVLALLRAARPTAGTVILSGHTDVVDVDVCGSLREWAFDPEEYTRRVGALELDPSAEADRASGNFLFGRGVEDMKAGLALGMGLLAEMSERTGGLDANLLFLAVCDEENNSAGMRGAIPHLDLLRREEGLDYLAFFLLESTAGKAGDPRGTFAVGTVGKLMPCFLCVGVGTHAGKYFDGLSAPLIASEIERLAEGNPETSDRWGDQVFAPMSCLKLKDLREVYSVTVPERAVAYYNRLTATASPTAVLGQLRDLAERGLRAALERHRASREAHRAMGLPVPEPDWVPRVLSAEELRLRAEAVVGPERVERELARLLEELPPDRDDRDRSLALLGRILDLSGERGPLVVTGYLPPFYPSRINRRETPGERAVIRLAEELILRARELGKDYRIQEVFPGISDLSWLGFQGDPRDLEVLAADMPGWGSVFRVPAEELRRLDVPVLNLGPFGYDSHRATERLEVPFSFEGTPQLLRYAVSRIGTLCREEREWARGPASPSRGEKAVG